MDVETIEQPGSLQNLHRLEMEKYTHYIQTFFLLCFKAVGVHKKILARSEKITRKLVRHNMI